MILTTGKVILQRYFVATMISFVIIYVHSFVFCRPYWLFIAVAEKGSGLALWRQMVIPVVRGPWMTTVECPAVLNFIQCLWTTTSLQANWGFLVKTMRYLQLCPTSSSPSFLQARKANTLQKNTGNRRMKFHVLTNETCKKSRETENNLDSTWGIQNDKLQVSLCDRTP